MCSFYHGSWRFWSDVPWNIRDRMFDEFRMKCAWPVEREAEVRRVFFKKCGDSLTDMFREARNKKEMPGWITEDIWIKLTEYWASEEFKKKSELAKAARLSDKGGSVHTGGSISTGAHRRRLEKSLKRPTTQDEVFEYTHMKKIKDGTKTTWIEPRAETTYNTFKQYLEEFIQSQPTDDQGKLIQPSQKNYMGLWIKAAGGVHKGRVYGLGSEFSSSHRSYGGSSSSRSSINHDEFEILNRRITEITIQQERAAREEEAKRREEEDRRREEEERQREE